MEQESILKQEIEAANEERKTQLMEEKQKELEAKKIEEQEELEKKQKETGFCILYFKIKYFFLYEKIIFVFVIILFHCFLLILT